MPAFQERLSDGFLQRQARKRRTTNDEGTEDQVSEMHKLKHLTKASTMVWAKGAAAFMRKELKAAPRNQAASEL